MSGHSKWATTKRHKAVVDAKRSGVFTKLARAITVAAKEGKNLDIAIEQARAANMPKDNIDRAIKRGQGGTNEAEIVGMRYEVYGPGGTGIIVDVLTDNKNRALSEIKATLNKYNGKLATGGAVSYLFEEQGVIELDNSGQTLQGEDLEMVIIDSGAQDYSISDGTVYVYTNPKELTKVKQALEFKSLKVKSANLAMNPKNYIDCDENKKQSIIKLLETLEDLDDVANVYTNANL